MSTRGAVCFGTETNWEGIYIRSDAYPTSMGPDIARFMREMTVEELRVKALSHYEWEGLDAGDLDDMPHYFPPDWTNGAMSNLEWVYFVLPNGDIDITYGDHLKKVEAKDVHTTDWEAVEKWFRDDAESFWKTVTFSLQTIGQIYEVLDSGPESLEIKHIEDECARNWMIEKWGVKGSYLAEDSHFITGYERTRHALDWLDVMEIPGWDRESLHAWWDGFSKGKFYYYKLVFSAQQ